MKDHRDEITKRLDEMVETITLLLQENDRLRAAHVVLLNACQEVAKFGSFSETRNWEYCRADLAELCRRAAAVADAAC